MAMIRVALLGPKTKQEIKYFTFTGAYTCLTISVCVKCYFVLFYLMNRNSSRLWC